MGDLITGSVALLRLPLSNHWDKDSRTLIQAFIMDTGNRDCCVKGAHSWEIVRFRWRTNL